MDREREREREREKIEKYVRYFIPRSKWRPRRQPSIDLYIIPEDY